MVPRKEVSFAMRTLLNQMRRLSKPYLQHDGQVTPMQGRVIGFVSHHADQDVFQRDLERAFEIRRSTASAILQTMERDGLLTREPVPYDAGSKSWCSPAGGRLQRRFSPGNGTGGGDHHKGREPGGNEYLLSDHREI
jgi:hypothetical protein